QQQQPSSPSLGFDWLRNGGPLLLLEQPSVQEDLKFSEEQKRQVGWLAARKRTALLESRELSLDRMRSKFEELAAQEKAVMDGLTPAQFRRLKQIAWQESGASAFSDPELVEALELTDTQKNQIRLIQSEAVRSARGIGHRPGGSRPEDWKKAEELWRKARDQAMAVLTEEQQVMWEELTGEPLKG